MDQDYILPGEFAILIAALFSPPLLLALIVQAWFLHKRSVSLAGSAFVIGYHDRA